MIKRLRIIGATNSIIKLLQRNMTNWKTPSWSGESQLGVENMSPLLFFAALIPTKKEAQIFIWKEKGKIYHQLSMNGLILYGCHGNETDRLVETVKLSVKIYE